LESPRKGAKSSKKFPLNRETLKAETSYLRESAVRFCFASIRVHSRSPLREISPLFCVFCAFLRLFVFSVNPQNHKALAYGTFRLALGVVELMHGLVRLPILAGFAANMVKQFDGTILPGWFVYSFGFLLPFVEGLIGLTLILGLFTRWALAAASLLFSILLFGTCLRSDWTIVGLQMIYVLAFFIALFLLEHNDYSLDRTVRREEP
jgi:thiosulfate dehydrogenase [quinone] large subunit